MQGCHYRTKVGHR